MTTPPEKAINAAIVAANHSPCAKSKRGVSVYEQFTDGSSFLIGAWFNGPPEPYRCGGDDACREACPKLCVHAEMRALIAAHRNIMTLDAYVLARVHLVHAKTVDGMLVAGGGPSCWQCSRLLLDTGFAGIWLYVTVNAPPGAYPSKGMWTFYTATEFHETTLRTCGLPRLIR